MITKNKVVSIHYTLTNNGGEVIDSSNGEDPLAFIYGLGQIIPGLEKELDGKATGDKFQVSIPPEEAYGVRNDQMVQKVPKTEFEEVETVQVGMQFQVDTPNGPMILTVVEILENELVLDANHPLAGETLNFDVEVSAVRDATQEELDHGHVHGPGGHSH